MTVCCYHVTYVFQSESTLYICLNIKEPLARNRCNIWSLSDSNRTPTNNHLVHKQTLNHFTKLTKRFSSVVSTYLYCAFDCMLLSCHVCISEWIHTLYLLECQIPCSKQVRYLKFKWLKQHLNPQPLSLKMNTRPFGQTDQKTELCYEYLSVLCISLHVIIISCTHFRVNAHSIFAWLSRNSLLKTGWHLNFKWLKQDLNPQPLSSKTNTQQFAQTDQRIEVCCEYLSVQCICIYFIIMWNRHFRVNSYSMFSWMSRNSLFEAGVKSEVWMVAMGLKPTTT